MAEKFVPKGDRLLVKPIEPPKKVGGMATPQAQRGKVTRGTVVAVGPLALRTFSDPDHGIAVGDTVEWAEYAGKPMTINGEKFLRLRLEEVEGSWEVVDG